MKTLLIRNRTYNKHGDHWAWSDDSPGASLTTWEHLAAILDAHLEVVEERDKLEAQNRIMRAYVEKYAKHGLENAIECLESIGVETRG